MSKKVLIIGAGLAGISTGIYLQKQGIQTEIFEISGQAGGMCIAWERRGYRFDGCIHWMVGTKAGTPFYNLYREVHALEEDTVIYNARSIKTEFDGITYEIPMTLKPFKNFLISVSPEDSAKIEALCAEIETMITTNMPAGRPTGFLELLDILKNSRGFLNLARKYVGIHMRDYVEALKNSTLKSILYYLMPPQYSFFGLIMMLGTRMCGNAGYPLGGAHDVINRMEGYYRELGGNIHFSSKVDKIVLEDGKAAALESGGRLYQADAIVAACDMYDVLKNMLGGRFAHKQLDPLLESAELFPPITVASFGLNKKFNLPFSHNFECPEGIKIDSEKVSHYLNIRSFEFDPSSAPENCSSVMVVLESTLEYWQALRRENPENYRTRKEELAREVISALDKRIPGFKDAVEVTDIATPATYIRYANLYRGSWEGFAPTPSSFKYSIKKKIAGIDGLFLCGQWTTVGGGICTAVESGKEASRAAAKYLK
ncbi:phytoene desaturase family protein [Ruminiclostridium cellobioparum]|uniref:Phytoene dehydrogenase family protein n=1 Tax=Ruminiclostridium cellobioparum subsp. termitidis CT1112 TaxID=1195236 RepID=S0FTF2_RUMCE|nr:NAD(P)/FAD-dependent oxidoreductase [Ruminiclostridium cellobioparum]EMS73611.1 phytoene dehydrogenase family protein [Ruminiclostridium cellobioparum subsp. termitidis CT1112]